MSAEPRLSLDREQESAERAMEALGASERAGAPTGLEDRVLAASISALRAGLAAGSDREDAGSVTVSHGARRVTLGSQPARRRGAGQSRRWIAVAAGLGAIACLAATWLALRGPIGGQGSGSTGVPARDIAGGAAENGAEFASIDLEVDALFAASSLLGTGLEQEIAAIRVEAAALGIDLTDPIAGGLSDGLSGGLTGGSWSGESL